MVEENKTIEKAKVAMKKTMTLYQSDFDIIEKESNEIKKINGTKFNLSSFIRFCLRDGSIMELYRKTGNYKNER